MTRPVVLLLARTGFIIRDIFLGKFTEEIIKDYDLIVVVPDPNNPYLMDFIKSKPIKLIEFYQPKEDQSAIAQYFSAQHWMYRIKQIQRNNTSLEINTKLLKSAFTPKKKFTISFITYIAKIIKKLHLIGVAEDLFLFDISHWQITQKWNEILRTYQPSVVISTGLTLPMGLFLPSPDLPILLAARKQKILCGSLVQSWDNLSSKTYVLPPWLDRIWTWSDAMTKDLLKYNPRIKINKIKVVGSPHYDFHNDCTIRENRDTFLKKINLNPKYHYIVIGTGTKSMFPDAPFIARDLARSIKVRDSNIGIIIRIHPKDDYRRWKETIPDLTDIGVIFQNTAPNVPMDLGGFIPPNEYFYLLINTLLHAAVVINISSSLTVDASIVDTPVITINYDREEDKRFPEGRAWKYNYSEHFKPLIDTGGVKVVQSESECIDAIFSYLENKSLDQIGRKQIANLIGGVIDSNSSINLAADVKYIRRRLNKKRPKVLNFFKFKFPA